MATRGIARSRASVEDNSYRAFKAALSRPERFQRWLSSHGVEVAGPQKLQWAQPPEDGETSLPRLRRLEKELARWLDRGAAEEEVAALPHQPCLSNWFPLLGPSRAGQPANASATCVPKQDVYNFAKETSLLRHHFDRCSFTPLRSTFVSCRPVHETVGAGRWEDNSATSAGPATTTTRASGAPLFGPITFIISRVFFR